MRGSRGFGRLGSTSPVTRAARRRGRWLAAGAGCVLVGAVIVTPGPASAAPDVLAGTITMPRGETVGGKPVHYRSIDMSAGQVYYADDTPEESLRTAVWRRTVTMTDRLRLGAPARIAEGSLPPIAFSAGRGAVGGSGWEVSDDRSATGPLDLLDRGTRIGQVENIGYFTADRTLLSGPYLVADAYDRTVRRADGSIAFVPEATPEIFGSRVVWVSDGTLKIRDLAAPTPATSTVAVPGGPYQRVAGVWGNSVVLLRVDPQTHLGAATLHDLGSGATRPLGVSFYGDGGDLAEVGDGVLAWGDTDGLYALDLTDPDADPVRVSTDTYVSEPSLALDAGRLAWRANDDTLKIAPLPFGGASPPRLLGVLAPRGVSPDGDGVLDTWRPAIDVTAPLDDVQVTIRRGTTLVRTLTGSAPDGSIRDIAWDGRDGDGDLVPAGTYTWTLTGTGDTGAVTGIGGTGSVTGTVTVGPLGYTPLQAPRRVLDTRKGLGAPKARIGAGRSVTVAIAGTAGVPETGASAVALNITAAAPSRTGGVTAYPAGSARPGVANLTFDARRTATASTLTALGRDGRVTFWNRSGTVDLYVEVVGWFPGTGSAFRSVTPAVVADTRTGLGLTAAGPIGPQGARPAATFAVAGKGGIPASGSSGVALTVAATGATRATDLTVHALRQGIGSGAGSLAVPVSAGGTTSAALTGLGGTTGKASVTNAVAGRTDVRVSTLGWFAAPAAMPLAPTRVVDTRDGLHVAAGRIAATDPVRLKLTGYGGLPTTGVSAVVLGVTVRDATTAGTLVLHRGGTPRVVARTVSFEPGRAASAFVLAPVDSAGRVTVQVMGTVRPLAAAHVTLTAEGSLTG